MFNSNLDNVQALSSATLHRHPLGPLSESFLNEKVIGKGALKRKRGIEADSHELGKPFTILVRLQELVVCRFTDLCSQADILAA